ncbi:MAG TPA: sugar-binding protein, partial [Armatimonadota bacterium]|nr:sugar-binding protein [Armatimonadota bacterium]
SYRLHKAKFDREIPLGSALHCYVFRTATEMVATVYAVGLPVDLGITLPKNVTVEAVDGSTVQLEKSLLKVGASPYYLVTPLKNGNALIKAIQSANVSGIATLTVDTSLQANRYLVRLINTVNRPIQTGVTVHVPAGWRMTDGTPTKSVTVPPAGKLLLSFAMDYPANDVQSNVGLTVTAEGRAYEYKFPVRTLAFPRVPTGVRVDGNLAEWTGTQPTVVLQKSTDVMPPAMQLNWKGPNDLSANTWWAWDERGLYFAAAVTDDVQRNLQHGHQLFAGDGIQFSINNDNEIVSGDYTGASHEFGCALTDTGVEMYTWTGKAFAKDEYQVAVTRDETAKRTNYEMFVSWKSLGMAAPQAGSVIGVNLVVNEDDGLGRKSWLQYAFGIAETKAPSLFPRCILAK